MKVYNRKDFLQFPAGTIFCKGEKWFFDNMSIKGHTWDDDFLYVNLCDIDSNDSSQWADRLGDSLKNGVSYPINNKTVRDGMFEEEAIFLVFEKEDLEFLIQIMKNSIDLLRLRQPNEIDTHKRNGA